MSSVLVTGAGGFIASHLVDALVRQSESVRAFVRYNSRNDRGMLEELDADVLRSVDVVAGDFEDPHAIARATEGVETVYHLGALISIPYSYLHPGDVVMANVLGTLNVLEACRRYRVDRLVQLSSSEVYGSAQYVPIDESHPLNAQSPYAATKIASDQLALSYYRSFELPVAVARPFNTYGPRQSARAVIPTIISQALSEGEIKLGNSAPTRDFCYVADTVAGLMAIANSAASLGEVVNLGTGKEISISDLADLIVELVDRPAAITRDPLRERPEASEVSRLCADNQKARNLLGWEPEWTLRDGLIQTIEWIAARKSEFKADLYNV